MNICNTHPLQPAEWHENRSHRIHYDDTSAQAPYLQYMASWKKWRAVYQVPAQNSFRLALTLALSSWIPFVQYLNAPYTMCQPCSTHHFSFARPTLHDTQALLRRTILASKLVHARIAFEVE